MVISIEHEDEELTPLAFPKLMKSTVTGNVVLFKKEGEGTIVMSNMDDTVAACRGGFDMKYFVDFVGTITLKNSKNLMNKKENANV